jgi:hypothetical protein
VWIGVVVAVIGAVVATVLIQRARETATPPLGCRVALNATTYTLTAEQARHATTIAAVGKRLGLPDHAVTIALAAALQESQLHNLAHGDRDSRGLFQQRPSQGWGTASQIMMPSYAADAFYRHLALVDGWQSLPVTTAAQRVQRSGSPGAYAVWESEARAIAQATTGEIPAGLSCRNGTLPKATTGAALDQAMAQELGSPALGTPLAPARGWTVATWLVGHAPEFGVESVTFDGQVWTSSGGRWLSTAMPGSQVQITRTS